MITVTVIIPEDDKSFECKVPDLPRKGDFFSIGENSERAVSRIVFLAVRDGECGVEVWLEPRESGKL